MRTKDLISNVLIVVLVVILIIMILNQFGLIKLPAIMENMAVFKRDKGLLPWTHFHRHCQPYIDYYDKQYLTNNRKDQYGEDWNDFYDTPRSGLVDVQKKNSNANTNTPATIETYADYNTPSRPPMVMKWNKATSDTNTIPKKGVSALRQITETYENPNLPPAEDPAKIAYRKQQLMTYIDSMDPYHNNTDNRFSFGENQNLDDKILGYGYTPYVKPRDHQDGNDHNMLNGSNVNHVNFKSNVENVPSYYTLKRYGEGHQKFTSNSIKKTDDLILPVNVSRAVCPDSNTAGNVDFYKNKKGMDQDYAHWAYQYDKVMNGAPLEIQNLPVTGDEAIRNGVTEQVKNLAPAKAEDNIKLTNLPDLRPASSVEGGFGQPNL